MANTNELVLSLRYVKGHVGKRAEGFEGIHGGYGIEERNTEGRMLLDFCDQKQLYVANTRSNIIGNIIHYILEKM